MDTGYSPVRSKLPPSLESAGKIAPDDDCYECTSPYVLLQAWHAPVEITDAGCAVVVVNDLCLPRSAHVYNIGAKAVKEHSEQQG